MFYPIQVRILSWLPFMKNILLTTLLFSVTLLTGCVVGVSTVPPPRMEPVYPVYVVEEPVIINGYIFPFPQHTYYYHDEHRGFHRR